MSDKQETIMVVDDTPANLKLLQEMLQGKGYRVVTFPRGDLALKAIAASPPDLILLDVMMPEMNGFEVCERLKADNALKEIPVIFISALTETSDKIKAFAAGGVDYVSKPFQLEEVNARVETHLRIRSLQRRLKAQNENLEQLVAQRTSELEASERRYRSLVEDASDVVYMTDENGCFTYINPPGLRMMGYEEGELIGKHYKVLIRPDIFKESITLFANQLIKRIPNTYYEYPIITKDGHELWFGQNLQLIMENDRVTGFQAVARDITERRRIEGLEKEKVKAEEANKAKSKFLANMSHEIRTPLNGILGMAEICLETTLDEEQKAIVGTINKEALALLEIVNEVLDISKIEAGKMEMEQVPFDLRTIFSDLRESFLSQTSQKGLELISSISPETPTLITGDPGHLKQILRNLIGNAIKFTHTGRIAVEAEQAQEQTDRIKLKFMVKDSGIGIPKEKLALIFESFTQADSSTTRKYGGTGLGITISKCLTELMGGEIGVDSEEGKGSTFWFTAVFSKTNGNDLNRRREVELRRTMESTFAPSLRIENNSQFDFMAGWASAEEDRKKIRILVAEDYPTSQAIIKRHLERGGYQMDLFENGALALDAFRRKHYDLILMDVEMPVMDGLQATKAIRALETERAALEKPTATETIHRVPIIAMTAHALREQKDLCLEAGMDDFLSKPFRKKELSSIVAKRLIISLSRSSISSGKAIMNPASMAVQNVSPKVARSDKPIDLERAFTEFEGDRELLSEVIAGFTEKVIEQIGTMREALSYGDAETVRREAHSIKGGASGLTADNLAKKAADLESKGKTRELNGADEILDDLEREFEALRLYIQQNTPPTFKQGAI